MTTIQNFSNLHYDYCILFLVEIKKPNKIAPIIKNKILSLIDAGNPTGGGIVGGGGSFSP